MKNSKITPKHIALTGILTAMALVVFVIEAQLPSLTPIPGIKLGLANIFTLFSLYILGPIWAFLLLLIRVTLGSVFSGQMSVFLYSMTGGLLAFLVMRLLFRRLPKDRLFAVSALSAMAHNTGQILTAVLLMRTPALFAYLPVLLISGIVTGLFTGFTAQFTLRTLEKNNALKSYLDLN